MSQIIGIWSQTIDLSKNKRFQIKEWYCSSQTYQVGASFSARSSQRWRSRGILGFLAHSSLTQSHLCSSVYCRNKQLSRTHSCKCCRKQSEESDQWLGLDGIPHDSCQEAEDNHDQGVDAQSRCHGDFGPAKNTHSKKSFVNYLATIHLAHCPDRGVRVWKKNAARIGEPPCRELRNKPPQDIAGP